METSQFADSMSRPETIEKLNIGGATCDTFRVKLYGKLHFLKRLKPDFANDIRYQEAFRKEFETGYRLEHPNFVRYISETDDGILMEYIDGETLSQRISNNPDYFKNRKNTYKFIRQLLDVVGYLHSHQVLHLDLKPDNILLTRINHDVKLIDLGCCYTDAFQNTTGHSKGYAAPEQLRGEQTDVRTDIYAIGRILEKLPTSHYYNKVIARCTAFDPANRYQTTDDILCDIHRKPRYFYWIAATVIAMVLASVIWLLSTRQQNPASVIIPEVPKDTLVQEKQDTTARSKDTMQLPVSTPAKTTQPKSSAQDLKSEMDRMIDKAYQSTIATFCDSVFPSPTTGRSWTDASTAFHNQTIQIGNRLVKKYPDIPESTIRQDVESRFQNLVAYVFNKMRENGQNPQ